MAHSVRLLQESPLARVARSRGDLQSSCMSRMMAIRIAILELLAMKKEYSIAEARDHLAAIVHTAEKTGPITLTRRGRPVAVLLSHPEYDRIVRSEGFWPALERFWASRDMEKLGIVDADFSDLRNREAGREFRW